MQNRCMLVHLSDPSKPALARQFHPSHIVDEQRPALLVRDLFAFPQSCCPLLSSFPFWAIRLPIPDENHARPDNCSPRGVWPEVEPSGSRVQTHDHVLCSFGLGERRQKRHQLTIISSVAGSFPLLDLEPDIIRLKISFNTLLNTNDLLCRHDFRKQDRCGAPVRKQHSFRRGREAVLYDAATFHVFRHDISPTLSAFQRRSLHKRDYISPCLPNNLHFRCNSIDCDTSCVEI
jgi:hypothetical protein